MKKRICGFLLLAAVLFTVQPQSAVKAENADISTAEKEGVIGEIETLTPFESKTGNEATSKIPSTEFTFEEGEKSLLVPISVTKKGSLFIFMNEVTDGIDYSSIDGNLYPTKECKETDKIGYTNYLFAGDGEVKKNYYVPKAGTYYYKVNLNRKYQVEDAKKFDLSLVFMSSADRTLKNKETTAAYNDYENKVIYYQVKVTKTSSINLKLQDMSDKYFNVNLTLLDSKKKESSKKESYSSNKEGIVNAYYTVSKGTYYIKAEASSSYQLTPTISEVTDSAGSSMKTAKTIGFNGKAVSGLVLVSDKTSVNDYFKFSLDKKSTVSITVNSKVSGSLNMEVLNSKGQALLFGSKILREGQNTFTLESDGSWEKGTFYIRITKKLKTDNGSYTIKIGK